MPDIVLATLNARWSHAAMGLRCLRANLGDLRAQSVIMEFTINDAPAAIVEQLVGANPRVVALSVYIWNLRQTEVVVAQLKALLPQVVVMVGGPEVSFGTDHTRLDTLADCVVSGEGEAVFADLCTTVLAGQAIPARVQAAKPDVQHIAMPYAEYSDDDLAHRIIYVEASRGCPFTCEFCLSSIEKKVRSFELEQFLDAMDDLVQRGCRTFKFVDRTFNLKPSVCQKILGFFYQRWPRQSDGTLIAPINERQMDGGGERNEAFFLHFEMVPDRLPEAVKEQIQLFPAGAIQFEIGIQSFTPEVGELISRRMNRPAVEANFQWLDQTDLVHVHADLIVGLPGETPDSFLTSYDQLHALRPEEIQVGILKLLPGTPLIRHRKPFAMVFNPEPPYDLMSSRDFPFATMQRFKRFARYHDLYVNSGRFTAGINLLITTAAKQHQLGPGAALLAFSDWLWTTTQQEHRIALPRQYRLLIDYVVAQELPLNNVLNTLASDLSPDASLRGLPDDLRQVVQQQRRVKSGS